MHLTELSDRSEILALLNRYARGVDRADWPLVRDCYHPDAHDDHGLYRGGLDGLIEFLQALSTRFVATSHLLGNHLAELDGDSARCETACLAWYRRLDRNGEERGVALGVRYLDRVTRRDGRWAIAERVVVLDWEQAFAGTAGRPPGDRWQRGARGDADPSSGFFHALPGAASPPDGDMR